ncbi:MATH domain and coiled-coil domain-containing protein At3g44790 [Capsella rubella]|nr:MATH domain and coiled-coil domain-containing protein At3g44790 [Capsella rubella]
MGYKKFTWVIKNFSSLQPGYICSDEFVVGGCKWYLKVYPKGFRNDSYMSMYLVVATRDTLPHGWRRYTRFRLTVVNELSDKLSQRVETERWLDQMRSFDGFQKLLLLEKLNAEKGGFLVNNEVKIIAELDVVKVIVKVDVVEVIRKLDVSKGSQEVKQPLKKMRLNGDDGAVSSHLHKETSSVDVNGFQVLPSQVESVKLIFEKHPDMAIEFRAKNQDLRTSCINVLLSLIKTLCQSLQDLSIDDLSQAEQALTYLICSGFKEDWLERKLEEVKEKKIEEQFRKTRVQHLEEEVKVFKKKCSETEEELKDLKQKCSDTEALLEKEKKKVLDAARAPSLTLNDVI